MAKQHLPSADVIRKLLSYDPLTGKLTWLPRDASVFADGGRPAEWRARNWNSKNAGRTAFTACDGHGYKTGSIFGILSKAHLVAWVISKGALPEGDIDHINGIRDDNRLANLRDVPHVMNMRNAKGKSGNTSGYNGVHWRKDCNRWRAEITVEGVSKHLGNFVLLGDAIAARTAAQSNLGFTDRHGATV